MNRKARIVLFMGALAFVACNNPTNNQTVENENPGPSHVHYDRTHTADMQLDTAIDRLEQVGDQVEANAEAFSEEGKSRLQEAKEGVKAGVKRAKNEVKEASKAVTKDVKNAAKKVGHEVNEAAKDVKNELKKKN